MVEDSGDGDALIEPECTTAVDQDDPTSSEGNACPVPGADRVVSPDQEGMETAELQNSAAAGLKYTDFDDADWVIPTMTSKGRLGRTKKGASPASWEDVDTAPSFSIEADDTEEPEEVIEVDYDLQLSFSENDLNKVTAKLLADHHQEQAMALARNDAQNEAKIETRLAEAVERLETLLASDAQSRRSMLEMLQTDLTDALRERFNNDLLAHGIQQIVDVHIGKTKEPMPMIVKVHPSEFDAIQAITDRIKEGSSQPVEMTIEKDETQPAGAIDCRLAGTWFELSSV